MKELTLSISYQEFECLSELDDFEQTLCKSAINIAKHAYAPYSRFFVGASVSLENGIIVCGNNQENSAYPSGLCAERVALFRAGAEYGSFAPLTMAIAAINNGELTHNPVSPCGACRQVFAEIEKRYSKTFSLILIGKDKIFRFKKAGDLLPLQFIL